ncbi:hypothetical protein PSAC2689_100167 [Paraburkholderia sacchari]
MCASHFASLMGRLHAQVEVWVTVFRIEGKAAPARNTSFGNGCRCIRGASSATENHDSGWAMARWRP